MFKYSLFICKCSERESHFDCHIDCHFDCNLQLIVNFLSDNTSELMGVRSGAERMKKYRAENKQKCRKSPKTKNKSNLYDNCSQARGY